MKTLSQILEAMKALDVELKGLLDKESLSDEEDARIDAIQAEQKDLEGQKVNAEKREKIQADIKRREAFATQPADKAGDLLSDDGTKVTARTEGQHDNILDDPKAGYATYGHFCDAVKKAGTDKNLTDETLLILNDAYGANTEAGSEGGFLVPVEYSNKMVERMNTEIPILGLCDRLTLTGSNAITINGMSDHDKSGTARRYGGVVVYFVGEGDQVTRSSLKFRKIDLKLQTMAALSFATRDMLNYVPNYGERLMSTHGRAIRDTLTGLIMFGTGVKQPLGAFVDGGPVISVAAETDQEADTILTENIYGMEEALWSESDGNAVFLYNQFCHKQLKTLSLAIGTGGERAKVFENRGRERFIHGYPAYRTNKCKALGDAGDIVLGDFGQYILATGGTEDMAMSIHLRFDYAETAFRTMFDVDGRPAWDTYLTPENGNTNDYASPFIKLAARA